MPRNIEFDNDAVMDAAMRAFRLNGFSGVSIKTLESVTGLSSGSLYNSFGGKDDIFVAALTHYNETVVRQRIRDHLEAKSGLEGVRSLFLSVLEEPGEEIHGCLLTNSAVEFGSTNSVAKPGIQQGLDMLEKGFQAGIDEFLVEQNAKPGSPFANRYSISAAKLLALYQGVLVLVRFGRSKEQLRSLINTEIDQLIGKSI